ncbi:MAG: hypothetical protein HYT88_04230 [Candidatus Omnitrophica bacterium]|nr:hypothetical protein [Candidatus Omnitrophota bacterium]
MKNGWFRRYRTPTMWGLTAGLGLVLFIVLLTYGYPQRPEPIQSVINLLTSVPTWLVVVWWHGPTWLEAVTLTLYWAFMGSVFGTVIAWSRHLPSFLRLGLLLSGITILALVHHAATTQLERQIVERMFEGLTTAH